MRLSICALVFAALAAGSATLHSQNDSPLGIDRLTLHGVAATSVTYNGRAAIRLIEPDAKRQGGIAVIKGLSLTNGTITLDVAGKRGQYAVPDDRGFIGVAFRVRPGAEGYECFYIRPDNGRADDQVRRNHSTQYVSHPAYTFARLRQEAPERYESYVDLESGAWTRLRVEVEGTRARLYVHDAPQPALIVNDLKLGTDGGGIALWIGAGTEGYFSALDVRAR